MSAAVFKSEFAASHIRMGTTTVTRVPIKICPNASESEATP